jgi:hypothetical protein
MSLNYTDLVLFEYISCRKMAGSCGAIFNFLLGLLFSGRILAYHV